MHVHYTYRSAICLMPFCSTPALEKHPCSLHVPTSGGGHGSSVLLSLATMLPARPQYKYRPRLLANTVQLQTDTNILALHPSIFIPKIRRSTTLLVLLTSEVKLVAAQVSLQIGDEGCMLQRGHERRDLAASSPPPRQCHCSSSSSIADDDNPASGRPRLGGCQEVAATATDGDHGHGHQHLPCQGRRPSTSDGGGGGQRRRQAHRGVQRQHEVGAGEQIQPQAELVSQSILLASEGHGRLAGIYKRPLGPPACTSSDDLFCRLVSCN